MLLRERGSAGRTTRRPGADRPEEAAGDPPTVELELPGAEAVRDLPEGVTVLPLRRRRGATDRATTPQVPAELAVRAQPLEPAPPAEPTVPVEPVVPAPPTGPTAPAEPVEPTDPAQPPPGPAEADAAPAGRMGLLSRLRRSTGPAGLPAVRGGRRQARVERAVVQGVALAAYVWLAVFLTQVHQALPIDSYARTANAQYVVSSRDTHLAAIGFVWNPLPSLVMLPFIPLRGVWPSLLSSGLLAALCSAVFMSAAVGVVWSMFRDLGLRLVARTLLTVAFAVHPMIALYGGNGMSEAPLLLFGLMTCRWLLAWIMRRRSQDLVATGLSLALAYLTRYEALAPGASVIVLVALITAWRTTGDWRTRRAAAVTHAVLVGMPFLLTVALFAVLSKVIVRQWFPTLSSEYGNTAQVGALRSYIEQATGSTTAARASYLAHQAFGLEPGLLAILGLSAVLALLRRDVRLMAPVACVGSIVAFDALAGVSGNSFVWLRFQIAVVPLAVVTAGLLVAMVGRRWLVRVAALAAACALLAPAFTSAYDTILDRKLGREESVALQAVLRPGVANDDERAYATRFAPDQQVARDIDRMHLAVGSVLTDVGTSFNVLLTARHTRTYRITPDEDFFPSLADPLTFHVGYILVSQPHAGSVDAIDRTYPDLYEHGGFGAQLVHEWKGTRGENTYRLYQLPATSG